MEVTAQQSEPLEEGAAAASVDPSLEHRDLQRQYHETTAAVKRAFTAYKKAAVATVGGKIAWDDEERSEAKASLSVVCDSLVKEKERCRQLLQKLEDKRDELEQQVDRLLGIGECSLLLACSVVSVLSNKVRLQPQVCCCLSSLWRHMPSICLSLGGYRACMCTTLWHERS